MEMLPAPPSFVDKAPDGVDAARALYEAYGFILWARYIVPGKPHKLHFESFMGGKPCEISRPLELEIQWLKDNQRTVREGKWGGYYVKHVGQYVYDREKFMTEGELRDYVLSLRRSKADREDFMKKRELWDKERGY